MVTITERDDARVVASGSTDTDGTWATSLPAGRYRVIVSLAGFEEQVRSLDLPATGNGAAVLVALRLEPARVETVVLDHRCSYDPLYELRAWRLCGDELTQLPID
jgi:hypothetical protein